jgi:hypothetical protein
MVSYFLVSYKITFGGAKRYLAAIEFKNSKNDAISISFSLYYLFDLRRNNESDRVIG